MTDMLKSLLSKRSHDDTFPFTRDTVTNSKIAEASVTILADFCPEFNPQFRWRSKHQTKNHSAYH